MTLDHIGKSMYVTGMATTALPALRGQVNPGGYDGRYRLYTIDHVPYGAFPAYRDGGPSKVTVGKWGTSTSSLDRVFSSPAMVAADDGRVTLNVYYVDPNPEEGIEYHPLDGTTYATQDDADRAAYEAGIIGYMVYEKSRAQYGLLRVAESAS